MRLRVLVLVLVGLWSVAVARSLNGVRDGRGARGPRGVPEETTPKGGEPEDTPDVTTPTPTTEAPEDSSTPPNSEESTSPTTTPEEVTPSDVEAVRRPPPKGGEGDGAARGAAGPGLVILGGIRPPSGFALPGGALGLPDGLPLDLAMLAALGGSVANHGQGPSRARPGLSDVDIEQLLANIAATRGRTPAGFADGEVHLVTAPRVRPPGGSYLMTPYGLVMSPTAASRGLQGRPDDQGPRGAPQGVEVAPGGGLRASMPMPGNLFNVFELPGVGRVRVQVAGDDGHDAEAVPPKRAKDQGGHDAAAAAQGCLSGLLGGMPNGLDLARMGPVGGFGDLRGFVQAGAGAGTGVRRAVRAGMGTGFGGAGSFGRRSDFNF